MAKKKMPEKLISLLVKARKLNDFDVKTIRRTFNNGELAKVRDIAWSNFHLHDEDIDLLKKIQHQIGAVFALLEKNKRIKKSRAKKRETHHHDVSQNIAHENDFLERSYLDTRGDAGQTKPAEVHQMPEKQKASRAA